MKRRAAPVGFLLLAGAQIGVAQSGPAVSPVVAITGMVERAGRNVRDLISIEVR